VDEGSYTASRCLADTILPGFPTTVAPRGTSRITTVPAPMMASSSTAIPGRKNRARADQHSAPERDPTGQHRTGRHVHILFEDTIMVYDSPRIDDGSRSDAGAGIDDGTCHDHRSSANHRGSTDDRLRMDQSLGDIRPQRLSSRGPLKIVTDAERNGTGIMRKALAGRHGPE
jgi:hypothetical protein